MDPSPETTEEVRRLARALLPDALDVSRRITEHVLQAVPELAPAGTTDAVHLVRESTDQNIGAMLSTLAFGITPSTIEPPAGTQELLQNVMMGGGDVTHLLRAYRVGHQLLWKLWSTRITAEIADGARLAPVLGVFADHLFEFIDRTCKRIVETAPPVWSAAGAKRATPTDRHQLVRRVLGPDPVNTTAASATLGYDLNQHHVAMLVAPAADPADLRGSIEGLVGRAPAKVLTVPSGEGTWWVWLGFAGEPGAELLASIAAHRVDAVLVGLGEPGRGRDGFRRSLAQARDAERIGRLPSPISPRVVRFREIEIVAMLCGDPDRARAFSAQQLGALGGRDETSRRIRHTLRVFFAHGSNRGAAARALNVHHKTVAYRINQAEELLGRPVLDDAYGFQTALLIEQSLNGE
jgi:hypothetical protein